MYVHLLVATKPVKEFAVGNLLEALTKTQLIIPAKTSAEESRRDQVQTKKTRITFTLIDVLAADSLQCFYATARNVLINNPSSLSVIITEAHRFRRQPEGNKTIAHLYRVREALKGVDDLLNQRHLLKKELEF